MGFLFLFFVGGFCVCFVFGGGFLCNNIFDANITAKKKGVKSVVKKIHMLVSYQNH